MGATPFSIMLFKQKAKRSNCVKSAPAVIMLSVIMLTVAMMSVIMLSDILQCHYAVSFC